MADITNKKLALLVLAALVVVVLATTIQLNKLNDFGPQGFAVDQDSGTVELAIQSSLNIQVDPVENSIQFGSCSPTLAAVIDSNDSVSNTTVCDGAAASGRDYIKVDNIGNINAAVNVTGDCDVIDFLPEAAGATNDFEVKVDECDFGTTATYATLEDAPIKACTNLSTASSIWLYARVTLDTDSLTNQSCGVGSDAVNTLTFDASDVVTAS